MASSLAQGSAPADAPPGPCAPLQQIVACAHEDNLGPIVAAAADGSLPPPPLESGIPAAPAHRDSSTPSVSPPVGTTLLPQGHDSTSQERAPSTRSGRSTRVDPSARRSRHATPTDGVSEGFAHPDIKGKKRPQSGPQRRRREAPVDSGSSSSVCQARRPPPFPSASVLLIPTQTPRSTTAGVPEASLVLDNWSDGRG